MSTSTGVSVAPVDDPMPKEALAVAASSPATAAAPGGATPRDLRLFFSTWCDEANLSLFSIPRAHLELFGRWMEEAGRMRSTVARRRSTLASFYKYCQQEQLVDRNPALHVRRPKVDYESRNAWP
jgi:site-specific recombinase XerD